MAGKITHLEVLFQVIRHLEHGSSEQKTIAKLLKQEPYFRYANVGTIAPDIFYYYHVLSLQKADRAEIWGDLHHHKCVAELILAFLGLIHKTEEGVHREKMLAFTLGYICHCVVDIITHPYIFFISGDYYSKDREVRTMAQYNHMKVEFALDAYLLDHRWGMSPKDYDFLQYINILQQGSNGEKMDTTIWYFWQQALKETFPEEFASSYIGSEMRIMPGDIINDSYIGFLRFNDILDSRSRLLRQVLKFADKISFSKFKTSVLMLPLKENIDPRIMNEDNGEWHYPADPKQVSHDSFINLVNKAAESAKTVICTAWEYLQHKVKREDILTSYQGYNLDTGLRYKNVEKMKEFSPL
ncbi:MAG: zinc dependent phospholipase C family protein [Spirochaetota bacterium]